MLSSAYSTTQANMLPADTNQQAELQGRFKEARRRKEFNALKRDLQAVKSELALLGQVHKSLQHQLLVHAAYPVYLLPHREKGFALPLAPEELWDDLPDWIGPQVRGGLGVPKLADDPLFWDNGDPCLLPFLPKTDSWGTGGVLIVPGGNYEFLTPHEAEPIARWLVHQLGIPAFILRHRLLPAYGLEEMGADFCAGILRARKYVDGGPIVAVGFSSGAHLTACVSASVVGSGEEGEDVWPNAQVFVYPSIDPNDWEVEDLCGFWKADVRSKEVQSLVTGRSRLLPGPSFVAPPPTFLVSSTSDFVCPPAQHTDPYARAMKHAGVECEYLKGDYGGHGYSHLDFWKEPCIEWLRRQGFGMAK